MKLQKGERSENLEQKSFIETTRTLRVLLELLGDLLSLDPMWNLPDTGGGKFQ